MELIHIIVQANANERVAFAIGIIQIKLPSTSVVCLHPDLHHLEKADGLFPLGVRAYGNDYRCICFFFFFTLVLLQTHLRRLSAIFAGNFFLEIRALGTLEDGDDEEPEPSLKILSNISVELEDMVDCHRFSSDFLPVAPSTHAHAKHDIPFETGGAVSDGFVMRDADRPSSPSRKVGEDEVTVLRPPGEHMV